MLFGKPRLVWLNTLKNSVRKPNRNRSVMAKFLPIERSWLMNCGPNMELYSRLLNWLSGGSFHGPQVPASSAAVEQPLNQRVRSFGEPEYGEVLPLSGRPLGPV